MTVSVAGKRNALIGLSKAGSRSAIGATLIVMCGKAYTSANNMKNAEPAPVPNSSADMQRLRHFSESQKHAKQNFENR